MLCEQYFNFAHALADNFLLLARGTVVASGPWELMGGNDLKQHLAL
ncbi:MAG: urea transport system ATP-binding protein [Janthinobacterium sp.]